MIPSPKLDDREYDDIVAEAIRLIPRYCPEWTNHNPSDPGITLLELAAWMTDLILFRLNRLPEKNYIAFLNLLGIRLRPPRSATALLQFHLVEGAEPQRVPIGTPVATPQSTDEDTITFETTRDLVVSSAKLDRCFSYYDERFTDNSFHLASSSPVGFEVFAGAERVQRFLYLSDPRFGSCGHSSVLRVFLGCPERGGRDLARLLEWEYWNGSTWKELSIAPLEYDRGEVAFFGPLKFESTAVNGIEGLWVRGRLVDVVESAEHTEIDFLRARVEVSGDGVDPDRAVVNIDEEAFLTLDMGKNMFVFGREPKIDSILYLSCDDLMTTPDAEVSIDFHLADPTAIPPATPSEELVICWEYYDGKKWRLLGSTGPQGVVPGSPPEFSFHDGTNAFTETGEVTFRRPKDLATIEISGEQRPWVRARIDHGDYGIQGSYTLDNEAWVYSEERPLRPPAVKHIVFRYREDYRELRHCLSFNDFRFTDFSDTAKTEFDIFQPFEPEVDESPTLYLGFDRPLPNRQQGLYFDMVEELGLGGLPDEGVAVLTAELSRYQAEREAAWEGAQRVVWEYYDGTTWAPLVVDDDTAGFTRSGFVDFVGPDQWQQTLKFTEERYWLRARLEMGGYVKSPRVRHVLCNCAPAHNATSYRDETLGSSDVTPLQEFKLLHGPVLPGEVIEVRERQKPTDDELEALGGPDALRLAEESEDGVDEYWIRWARVESFFESGPRDRHYLCDYDNGVLTFGDGRQGMVPPEGRANIVARSYRTGGGAQGNVNANSLTALTRTIAYIDKVTNPLAATGGADPETVEEAKARAPYTIKSRDRAVTAEDFETLALRASTSLARAKCIESRTHRGAVTLVVIPKGETEENDLRRKPLPSPEILRHVERFLDERRLVGTMLDVIKPRYRDLSLRVFLVRRAVGANERIRRDIENRLRRYLHPLGGGRDASGWPFGRSVIKTELVQVVEQIPGIPGVDDIVMFDLERGVQVEQLRIEDDQLPFLLNLDIVERIRDEVM